MFFKWTVISLWFSNVPLLSCPKPMFWIQRIAEEWAWKSSAFKNPYRDISEKKQHCKYSLLHRVETHNRIVSLGGTFLSHEILHNHLTRKMQSPRKLALRPGLYLELVCAWGSCVITKEILDPKKMLGKNKVGRIGYGPNLSEATQMWQRLFMSP